MTTPLRGLPNNVITTIPAAVNIASSTNASPIVVQTSSAHGAVTGDAALITGHRVNTNANGNWIITVVDSTHYSLNGSTGNGVGATTGTARTLALGADFVGPADHEDENAASVNPAYEALADRTCFLWFAAAREFFRLGVNETLTSAATGQHIDTTYRQVMIPATLAADATFIVEPGFKQGDELHIFRDQSPDVHSWALSCAGGNTFTSAPSKSTWIHIAWDGTNWKSVANGDPTNWAGPVLV